jgi:hypothetical protein
MGSPASADWPAFGGDGLGTRTGPGDRPERSGDGTSIGDIVEQLKLNPEECWHAMEGLGLVEPDVQLAIIAELSRHQQNSGASSLLRMLCSVRDASTRAAARAALRFESGETTSLPWYELSTEVLVPSRKSDDDVDCIAAAGRQVQVADQVPARGRIGLVGCLVTPVNGQGCGSIAVSASQKGQRRTAAFLCDVRRGIRDVVGDVEPESSGAGRLIDEVSEQVRDVCVRDVPELALGLLAGSLMLCGTEAPSHVRDWLVGTLGPDFQPSGFPATIPGVGRPSISSEEMPMRARAVLDACPTWLDTSPLTCELGREIFLREGRVAADPNRDAGAYRYLFEHRLIHRLELYRRKLLWMAWFWWCLEEVELADSAQALALQLADEQYAVPSHPFTTALMTRSLEAAQAGLRARAT